MNTTKNVHIYFVLDRSGSMESIAGDVIGGFNAFLTEQKADGDDAVMTLIQFDTGDPHEVLADALPLAEIPPLTAATFVPRGGTPLYDAMGQVIADATIRAERRAAAALPDEEIVFVTFTDGEENSSVEYSKAKLFNLVTKREAQDWAFVFLGANQDSYAEGGGIGLASGNIQDFDAGSAPLAFRSLSASMLSKRQSVRTGAVHDRHNFFDDDKPAERELRGKTS
jgi:Mg-chelatase subunit ChlD